jgi:hypothetical protein
MIAIFGDFCQFSAKKLPFFSKTNVMVKFLQKLAVVSAKNANIFVKFLGKNILKIITSPEAGFFSWQTVCRNGKILAVSQQRFFFACL